MSDPITRIKLTMFYQLHELDYKDIPIQNRTIYYDMMEYVLRSPKNVDAWIGFARE